MKKKTVLPNGIKLITEYMPEAYSATVMVWAAAGPDIENEKNNGISHFIEHLLFKGTETRNPKQIVEAVENRGGSINAFTDKDFTCYYAKVLKEESAVTVDVLLDMVFNSKLDKNDIEIERKVILEEIKMYEDAPDELVYDLFLKSYWNDHPLGQPITGTLKSVSKITRDDILEFMGQNYTPDNILISVAGNFDENQILDAINEKTFHLKSTGQKHVLTCPNISPKINFTKKDIEQAHICIGSKAVSLFDDSRYILALMDICLGGGMASRLFQEIREKRGLVYSINTYEALYRQTGVFGAYAATNPENADEVIKLVIEEFNKLKVDGLIEDELEKAKSQIKGNLLIGLESTKFRASRNARSELYFNRDFDIQEICSMIENVTDKDVIDLANQVLDPKNMAITVVGPKKTVFNKTSLPC
ncbi:MAG: pitrilysin family protein [bacterium]